MLYPRLRLSCRCGYRIAMYSSSVKVHSASPFNLFHSSPYLFLYCIFNVIFWDTSELANPTRMCASWPCVITSVCNDLHVCLAFLHLRLVQGQAFSRATCSVRKIRGVSHAESVGINLVSNTIANYVRCGSAQTVFFPAATHAVRWRTMMAQWWGPRHQQVRCPP